MTMQTLTLQVPEVLFTRLKQRAEQANRTVEAETLNLLATAVPEAEELPADLQQAITSLGSLEDEALWRAAHSRLAAGDRMRGATGQDPRGCYLHRPPRPPPTHHPERPTRPRVGRPGRPRVRLLVHRHQRRRVHPGQGHRGPVPPTPLQE